MKFLLVAAVCTFVILLSGRADSRSFEVDQSDPPCMPAKDVFKFLADNYREHPVAIFSSSKVKYVLFVTSEPRSWTLAGIVDDKIACLVSEGDKWLVNKNALDILQK